MKENQTIKPVIDLETGKVHFEFRGRPTLTLDMSRLHPDIIRRAAAVGMAQVRIVDAAAVGMTDDDGNIIPKEERDALKYERMLALIEHYESGTAEWSRVGSGGGGGRSITLEAVARVKGWTYEKAQEEAGKYAQKAFAGDTKKCLAKLRQSKDVAEAILAIRAERAPTPKVDADAALNELGAE